MKKVANSLDDIFKDLKYYDIWSYLQCAVYFNNKIKLKVIAIKEWRFDILDEIEFTPVNKRNSLIKKYDFLEKYMQKTTKELMEEFEDFFYELKDKKQIETIYKHIDIDTTKYPLYYNDTNKLSFKEYQKSKYYWYYNATSICFSHIVNKYNRKQEWVVSFFEKIYTSIENGKKFKFIKDHINENNKIKTWKSLHEKMDKYFETKDEFQKYLITYLINHKYSEFKKLFYWEAVNERLSENEWAEIGWANLFYLQKIDDNIWDFNMLLFFKQFKDTLIDLYNSIFWPFIKPYFYYILIFKSIKLPLKSWQKFFFLLVFFSAESYEEYSILQRIYKSIERIWLWNYSNEKSKIVFYTKRLFHMLLEFYSSIFLLLSLVYILWFFGLVNIIMAFIIVILIFIWFLRYLFFPGRFEILRSFTIIVFSILWYVWFTTIFPKITQPEYISYLWKEINSLVSLDINGTKENYKKMITHIYGEKYRENEKKIVKKFYCKTKEKIQESKEKIKSSWWIKNYVMTNILKSPKYVYVKKWQYLKYFIDKEIDKFWIKWKDKELLSKKVYEKYVKSYCNKHNDIYCKTNLEKIPVWFKIDLKLIDELING